MSLSDYLPSPKSGFSALVAPFKKREGQPWLQGTARNLGHAAFGDKIGNYVDQNYLGDPAPGQMSPASGMAGQMQAQAQPQPQIKGDGQQVMQLLQQLMKAKGGM